jgi:hypothetical protein
MSTALVQKLWNYCNLRDDGPVLKDEIQRA